MLRWTVVFLVVAIVAAIFGFGGIAAGTLPSLRFYFSFSPFYFLLHSYLDAPPRAICRKTVNGRNIKTRKWFT